MPISSNTLFHFTNSADNLINILINEFHPNYTLEPFLTIFKGLEKEEMAIPMLAFCDLPLSDVSEHIGFYGNYGLGMTKSWGIGNGINPVMYLQGNSLLANHLGEIIKLVNSKKLDKKDVVTILSMLTFLKPYEGKMYRKGNYVYKKFYDEREWRYIPRLEVDENNKVNVLYKEEFLNNVKLSNENAKIRIKHKLSFEPKDIKYIIVKDESEIPAMIDSIKTIKGEKYTSEIVDLLLTRIVSSGQILTDF